LQALMSYTWAKSLDVVSEESILNFQAPVERVPPTGDRGPSSFDIRQSLSLAISYEPPRFRGPARRVLTGWAFDSIVRARSAPPVNVLTGVDTLGLGFNTVSRPDVAPGVPLYLEGNEFAGGKRINPAAFVLPAGTRQGTLGRNSLRGFGAAQWDLAVRRHFVLTEGLTLQFRADAYNLTNHPNFASPVNMLNNPNFGHSTQMLNRGLAGLSPLYQIGGPRSMQVAARLIF
jgi:hypothetical protein